MAGTQEHRKHNFECDYCTADPTPTLSQVGFMPTRAGPALDQVSGTSTMACTGGAGLSDTVGVTDDELSQGEVVYEVPSVADILLLLQRSTPPMTLRSESGHSAAMPPASRCGVGGNATATSPRAWEAMSVQVATRSKHAPAPPQTEHTSTMPDTYLTRTAQHVPQGDSSLPWADTPRKIPTADMVLPQYQPSFTEGSTLSPREAIHYTLQCYDECSSE